MITSFFVIHIYFSFNSGVMLQDLQKLNAMKWDMLWVNLTKRLTLLYGQTE